MIFGYLLVTLAKNSTTHNYFLDVSDDLTNNVVESKNYSLNSCFTRGRKTLGSLCSTNTKFRKKHLSDRFFATRKNDKRYLRRRDPKLIQRFERRRTLVSNFSNLDTFDQCQSLWQTMITIGELGPTVPSTWNWKKKQIEILSLLGKSSYSHTWN